MPATRSGTRQGSRQPGPYPQDSSGAPVTNAISLTSDEDGPPRKRQAVERKSFKQRSKQKARAPLPPAAEIIEISSDEDEPPLKKSSGSMGALERKVKELEEENKRLKAAAAASTKTAQVQPVAQLKPQGPAPDARFEKFLSTIEDDICCEVCTLKMWHPYTLSCGHTFCKTCLQDWFSTALAQHLAHNPQYDAQKLVPMHYRNTLARPDLPSHTRRHIEREIAVILSNASHPQYSCPTCRVLVRAKPAENFVVKHLVRTIAGVQGETPPKGPAIHHPPGMLMDGPFDGFFPCNGSFL